LGEGGEGGGFWGIEGIVGETTVRGLVVVVDGGVDCCRGCNPDGR